MENSNNLILKWEKLGLLGISKNKKNTAMALELTYLRMLDNDNFENWQLIITAVSNIFSEIKEDKTMVEIIDEVKKINNEFDVNFKKRFPADWGDKNFKIHTEDKFIIEFCDKYKNKHIKTYKARVYTPEDLNEFTHVDTGIDQKLVERIETTLKYLDNGLSATPILIDVPTLDISFGILDKNEDGKNYRKYQIKIGKVKN